jgi:hypothetical protein
LRELSGLQARFDKVEAEVKPLTTTNIIRDLLGSVYNITAGLYHVARVLLEIGLSGPEPIDLERFAHHLQVLITAEIHLSYMLRNWTWICLTRQVNKDKIYHKCIAECYEIDI